jgi:hypothetical protein
MFVGERDKVSKMRTSPACCNCAGCDGVCYGRNVGEAEFVCGETRELFSAAGESEYIPTSAGKGDIPDRFEPVSIVWTCFIVAIS